MNANLSYKSIFTNLLETESGSSKLIQMHPLQRTLYLFISILNYHLFQPRDPFSIPFNICACSSFKAIIQAANFCTVEAGLSLSPRCLLSPPGRLAAHGGVTRPTAVAE